MTVPHPNSPVQWKAKNAWQCALALILVSFSVDVCLSLSAHHSPAFRHWLKSPLGLGFTVMIQGGFWLFFALLFSSATSAREFLVQVGLKQRPTLFGWWAAVVAIGIALVDNYGTAKGWSASSRRPYPLGYEFLGGAWWFFALKSVVIVPFYEEVVMRGFLYRAFRGSYGRLLSILLIVCVSAYFHWGSVSQSLFTLVCLVVFGILLCIVREQTSSLWNCLLCHAVLNAFALHLWLPAIIGMLLLLTLYKFMNDKTEIRLLKVDSPEH